MSSADNVKVAMTFFPIQLDDIRMSKFGTEPMPLCIIKFEKYLQKYSIKIPTNVEAIGLLRMVLAYTD